MISDEDFKLLVKDVFARFPYYPLICDLSMDGVTITEHLGEGGLFQFKYGRMEIVPYLRPLSSMTETEKVEFVSVFNDGKGKGPDSPGWVDAFDWLNEHHFDYRGLIKKGLAKPATEDMYNRP